jgi:predicted lysophospholipase L1 biosynthesis ABC-type transport system permease subunit
VINERLAARYFPGQNPIGQRIRFIWRDNDGGLRPDAWRTIVGVGPTLRHRWPLETEQVIYTPHRQDAESRIALVVRSRVDAKTIMAAVQREVQALDRDQPVFMAQTIDQMLTRNRHTFIAFGGLLILFALIAVLMAAVGLYAVMSSSVNQRMREIGIRMALGADPRQVSWLVLRRGLIQLAIGLAVGVPGALATARLVRAPIVQVTPTDPINLLIITILLAAVALAACLVPARRATRIDPLVALRAE